ncbi:MAG: nicotinate (nicotinamide) nucleotide adenylyltransferase [bacterium]
MAIGVLGGAFNPPHIGHLVFAQEAAAQLGLKRVHLVPTGRAPHKQIADDPGMTTRLEMLEIAAAENHLLHVDRIEIEAATGSERPSYTVHTLEALAGSEQEIVLLMGADVAAHLEEWHQPRRVLERARVGIAARAGTDLDDVEAALERLGSRRGAEVVKMPGLEVSSTQIRRRLAQGRPARYLVPDGVLELIEAAGLYRG